MTKARLGKKVITATTEALFESYNPGIWGGGPAADIVREEGPTIARR
jgi:hypothetical protein